MLGVIVAVFLFGDIIFMPALGELDEARLLQETSQTGYVSGGAERIVKISDISGPRIDSGAAMIENTGNQCLIYGGACASLPTSLWIGLLVAYIVLLIGNFAYGFRRSTSVQWFWEAIYTLFALWAWYLFDGCGTHIWFSLYVLKFGAVIFGLYLYLFTQKRNDEKVTE